MGVGPGPGLACELAREHNHEELQSFNVEPDDKNSKKSFVGGMAFERKELAHILGPLG